MTNRAVHRFLALFLAGAACVFGGAAWAVDLTDEQRAAIEARIKPAGQSCLEGDSSCGGPPVSSAPIEPRSGQEVYLASCLACHDSGVAGAPRQGNVADWADRIAKGMDALYESGVKGVPGTGMMAKGGCVDCTEDEIHAAVEYMVENSQ